MSVLKVIKKLVNILSNIVYLFIIAYVLVCLPIIIGYKPLVVLSGSMKPTFKVGSVIYYKKVDASKLHEDDIITFHYDNETFITHRIIKIEDGMYQTKGDANNTPDYKMIPYENIQGKVPKISLPYLGYYVNFINNHVYLLFISFLILVIEFILDKTIK